MKLDKKEIIILAALILSLFLMQTAAYGKTGVIPEIQGEFKTYTAKPGEDLYPIAKKFGLAIEHLMFANNMKGLQTYSGQKLLIPLKRIPPSAEMQNGIVLNLAERGLYVYEKGKVVSFYPVAIGATGKWMTPTGDYKIITKVKDPVWIPPEWAEDETPVPAGPGNPLGDRWMGLNAPGYGIHATNRPITIGQAASHGCLRMYPESAHKLFEQVYVGMPVKIVYEPVKLGYDPTTKNIMMEVYPDVYGKTSGVLQEAKRILAENGLLTLVGEKELTDIVSRMKGIPEPILGSDIIVKVNNEKQVMAFSPLMKDGKIWTTSEVLKPIGAVLQWNNEEKTVDIYRGKKKVSLKVLRTDAHAGSTRTANNGEVSFLWNGRTIIPLSYVLKKLDVNYQWQGKDRTLLVYSGEINNSKSHVKKPVETPITKKYFVAPTPKPTIKETPGPMPSPSPSEVPLPSPLPDEIPPQIGIPDESPSPSPVPSPSPSPAPSPSPEPGNDDDVFIIE